jgi:UDP-N-acetylmuramate--alanine ligase
MMSPRVSGNPFIGRRRLVVFQPHRFSRTKLLEQEFMRCFDQADGLIITDIYSAHEAPIPEVSGERLAGLIEATGYPCVRYVPRADVVEVLRYLVQPADCVFFLGAGDIGELCHDLASRLRATQGTAG